MIQAGDRCASGMSESAELSRGLARFWPRGTRRRRCDADALAIGDGVRVVEPNVWAVWF